MINRNKRYLKEDKGQASTLPMLVRCLSGIKKDNLKFSQLIGTDIYDIDYDNLDSEEIEEIMNTNYEALYRELYRLSNSFVYQFSDNGEVGLCSIRDIDGLTERLAIKDGVNCYKNTFGIVIVAYYGRTTDKLYLVPVSSELATYLAKIVDESDFDESTTLDGILSEYSY